MTQYHAMQYNTTCYRHRCKAKPQMSESMKKAPTQTQKHAWLGPNRWRVATVAVHKCRTPNHDKQAKSDIHQKRRLPNGAVWGCGFEVLLGSQRGRNLILKGLNCVYLYSTYPPSESFASDDVRSSL